MEKEIIDFAKWYSGMERSKVERAYSRYLREVNPVLHLNLIRKWFDIIGNPKDEEYRAITAYWSRIFTNGKIKIKDKYYHPTDVIVCFSNGYAKDRPQKRFKIKGVKVGFGYSPWGADGKTQYYILQLGERVS